MTDADINQLRDLLRAATPGPLTVMARNHGEQCVAVVNKLELVPPNSVELAHEKADADFIAAAVNALPGLLDEVRRLRSALEITPAPVTLEAAEWAIGVFRAEEEARRDNAIESVRKAMCALPRYSFVLNSSGGVSRVDDCAGRWIEWDEAHKLFDPEMVAWLLSKAKAEAAIDAAMKGEK